MVDKFTKEKRSAIMSRVRSQGSPAELRLLELVRAAVRDEAGGRIKVIANASGVLGSPDAYIPKLRLAFFMDGCFFHGCETHKGIPNSNIAYWSAKILANCKRDVRVSRILRLEGISVWRIWEHDLRRRRVEKTMRRIKMAVARRVDVIGVERPVLHT